MIVHCTVFMCLFKQDEAIKTVQVSQVDTKVRTLTIQEDEAKVELTLWREKTEEPINIGDFIEVSHCVVSEWMKKKTLNTTRNTIIKVFTRYKNMLGYS